MSWLGVVLVAEPVVSPDDGVGGGVEGGVADGVLVSVPVDEPDVPGAMLPVVDGLLMLPLVDGEADGGGVLLGVEGDEVDDDGDGLDVSLLLQPYTMVSAVTANAIEIGLRIICETYD